MDEWRGGGQVNKYMDNHYHYKSCKWGQSTCIPAASNTSQKNLGQNSVFSSLLNLFFFVLVYQITDHLKK